MDKYTKLNDVLVRLFNEIMDYEGKVLLTSEFRDITNNDMHVIDAIGIGKVQNMSTIASKLSVTIGTLTIAVNGLVRKGYVLRERSQKDRRVVLIRLSPKGIVAYHHHKKFHDEMVEAMVADISAEEIDILIHALNKIDYWMREKVSMSKES